MSRKPGKAQAAEALAARMAAHAYCETHPLEDERPDCPYCLDRAAYAEWLASGGHDYRPVDPPGATTVSLFELRAKHEGIGYQ
ncbi:hypothetical protein [Nonomuraea sp. SYSU D8015]|uniref:hypothetical protein n=1 Tax=Nonomuraea sp. SYSU D8015 TaxID=2593644 RepID=UPI001660149A|nr:hypothetical protein [Nonomuraea sp. SYSU D8015]